MSLSFSQGRTTVLLSIPPERQVESCFFCPLYLTGKRRGSHTKRRGSQLIKNSLRGIGLQSSLSTTEAPSKDFWPDELIQLNLTGHSNPTCNFPTPFRRRSRNRVTTFWRWNPSMKKLKWILNNYKVLHAEYYKGKGAEGNPISNQSLYREYVTLTRKEKKPPEIYIHALMPALSSKSSMCTHFFF